MGPRNADRRPMRWQVSLGEMARLRVRLAFCCTARGCDAWVLQDVAALAAEYGAEGSVWDERPRCAACGARGHYMCSPGEGTPFTPLLTGQLRDAERRAFLRQFGFSKRDVLRIRLLAEDTTATYIPAALNDLDVPFRVAASPAGEGEARTTGDTLGEWKGPPAGLLADDRARARGVEAPAEGAAGAVARA